MPRSATSEQDVGGAENVELCEITLYLHSAGLELLVKQRAVGALPPFTKPLTKVGPIERHVFATLSTCCAAGWGRAALWVYATQLAKVS